MVRHELPKLACAGSSPVTRSKKFKAGLQFRTVSHRWRFIRRPAFLMGASRLCQLTWDIGKSTSSLVCISLSQDLPHCPRWGFVALAESYALFSQDLPWCGNPTIAKTKISAFLQLFCDCESRCSRIIHGSSFPLRESFSGGGELVTTVILGSACFPLGFVDSRNSLLNQRPREGTGHAYSSLPYLASQNRERFLYDQFT